MGEPTFFIPRPAAFDGIILYSDMEQRVGSFDPDWLYFGTLLQTRPESEQVICDLVRSLPAARCFYDMNLRKGHWDLGLVRRLSALSSILKLNEYEARTLAPTGDSPEESFNLESFCRAWAGNYDIELICVTLGADGCFIYQNDCGLLVPGYPVIVQDTVGSGDAFAAAFLHGCHAGWPMLQTGRFANALGSVVASRSGAVPAWTAECLAISARMPPLAAVPPSF